MKKNKSSPENITSLLKGSKQVSHLTRMLEQQQKLLDQICALLPKPLDNHCVHARISSDHLILHVDAPVWATKIRFYSPTLLRAVQQQAPHIKEVKTRVYIPSPARTVRVQVDATTGTPPQSALKRLSQAAKNSSDSI